MLNKRFRVVLDAAASIAMIIAAGVLVWTSLGRRPPPPPGPGVPGEPQSLAGVASVGSADAKVAVLEYTDFQCPFCGKFARETWPALKRNYVDKGMVLWTIRQLPLSIHPLARPAAIAAECAGRQGRFWDVHDWFFSNQAAINDSAVKAIAGQFNLDAAAFEPCSSGPGADTVGRDEDAARRLGITGTPTFLIGRALTNGSARISHVISGARSLAEFTKILDQLSGQ